MTLSHAFRAQAAPIVPPHCDLASPWQPIAQSRLDNAKVAFVTRRAERARLRSLITHGRRPAAGDLVLARVQQLGQHRHLQLPDGRRCALFVGDEIVLAYGARYAPDQYEAHVPSHLGSCHLVAGGGLASEARSWSSQVKSPTRIEPVGLLGDEYGQTLNLRDFAMPADERCNGGGAPVIAVVGTAMNAGKTTAAASVIHGATRAGLAVGAAKVTGTGAGNDYWSYVDAGAKRVLDFTDCGYASTYLVEPKGMEKVLSQLVLKLQNDGADLIVLEIADGLYQRETAALACSSVFTSVVDGVLFCAGDAMGAAGGVDWLEQRGVPVLGISGTLTRSPLASHEAATATRLPVWTRGQLMDPDLVRKIELHCRASSPRNEALA